jgi:hypothetical protein
VRRRIGNFFNSINWAYEIGGDVKRAVFGWASRHTQMKTMRRFLQRFACIGMIAATAGASLEAQSTFIGGPTLGFVPSAGATSISQIIGIPGASILTDPLVVDGTLRGVAVAPKQDYAIAVRVDDGQLVMIDLASSQVTALSAANPDSFLLGISPRGSAVAVYDGQTARVLVIGQLPQAPQVVQELDASGVAGQASTLAVSDDGTVVLLRAVNSDGGSGLWILNALQAARQLPVDQPSGLAFFAGRNDVIVGDDATATAFVILDLGRTETEFPLVGGVDGMAGFSSIAASDDGTRLFLADRTSGNVALVDVSSGRRAVLSCDCQVTGISRLRGNDLFRLNETSQDPINVLDSSGFEPRIVIIPPNVSVASGGAQ